MDSYEEFLKRKVDYGTEAGFEPLWMPDFLFDFQQALTTWTIRKGRAAIFADCGMGKTPMQLVWSQNVVQKTGKPVLILTPLAVSLQTLEEAEKFGIGAHRADPGKNPTAIQVTNYEQLHKYDASRYAGVVCDESSILKNFDGEYKAQITEFMRQVPYRLLCTATAAPNDWIELGTSSEALGYLGYSDMLTTFFKRHQVSAKSDATRQEWLLKPHAAAGPFWQWVTSWARVARRPADLGFDDDGFRLPLLKERDTLVTARQATPGMLFDMPAVTFHEEREATRRTIIERCEAVAEKVANNGGISMVWCHLNDEGNTLERMIPGSVQVAGADSDEKKEEAVRWFVKGQDSRRVLISKPRILGFGLNFQHCHHMSYFPSHSYEQYYQATRRLWRFGQTKEVLVDRIYTDGGHRIITNLQRKSRQADAMFADLVHHMDQELHIKNVYTKRRVEAPKWLN